MRPMVAQPRPQQQLERVALHPADQPTQQVATVHQPLLELVALPVLEQRAVLIPTVQGQVVKWVQRRVVVVAVERPWTLLPAMTAVKVESVLLTHEG